MWLRRQHLYKPSTSCYKLQSFLGVYKRQFVLNNIATVNLLNQHSWKVVTWRYRKRENVSYKTKVQSFALFLFWTNILTKTDVALFIRDSTNAYVCQINVSYLFSYRTFCCLFECAGFAVKEINFHCICALMFKRLLRIVRWALEMLGFFFDLIR